MSAHFVIRYFSKDKEKTKDIAVELHKLNQPREYDYVTTLQSFTDFHGNTNCDIEGDYINLKKWPECIIYLYVNKKLYPILYGTASFNHYGEPNGYVFE